MISPSCFILSLGTKDHRIPEWHTGREPRGTRCRFCPSQNSSRPWGSGSAGLLAEPHQLSWVLVTTLGMCMKPEPTSPPYSFHHLGDVQGKHPNECVSPSLASISQYDITNYSCQPGKMPPPSPPLPALFSSGQHQSLMDRGITGPRGPVLGKQRGLKKHGCIWVFYLQFKK